jgi:hypothetical protein
MSGVEQLPGDLPVDLTDPLTCQPETAADLGSADPKVVDLEEDPTLAVAEQLSREPQQDQLLARRDELGLRVDVGWQRVDRIRLPASSGQWNDVDLAIARAFAVR